MIKTIFILFVSAGLFTNNAPTTLNVSTKESQLTWKAAKVGGAHNGVVTLKSGNLIVDNGVVKGGEFTIDMTTIICEDLQGEYKGKLEGHLKSDDFFGVATFPTASFVITSAVAQGENKYKIVGNLTIKGITKEIRFPATVTSSKNGVEAVAEIVVDRSQFNVRYGSGSFFDNLGDKVIYDDFTIGVKLVAAK